jgi:plastocyanin
MSRRTLATLACGTILVLAACVSTSGGPASSVPSAAPSTVLSASTSVAPSVGRSVAPSVGRSAAPSVAPSSASVCAESSEAGEVAVSIEDFAFTPATIVAKAAQVIAFTNTGFEHHNVTLDAGGCATRTLETGQHDGLVFTTVGSYPFHCSVHAWMAGMITIAR